MHSHFRMPGRTTDVFFSLLLHCPSWRYQRELHDGSRMYGPSVGDETGSQWDKLYAFPHIKCGADEQFL